MAEKKLIYVVEGARGMAAYYILFHHAIFLINAGGYFSENFILKLVHDFSAGFTVHILMMFFLLSGFSVHYANYGRITGFDKDQFGKYYYKRVRRIYPIYFLAVVLSLVAIVVLEKIQPLNSWHLPGRKELFGALFFFSDLPSRVGTWISTLSTNGPLWSLSYEVLYYILYPFFAVLSARSGIAFAVFAAATISALSVLVAVIVGPSQISNMLSLYVLWCAGALLGALKREGRIYRYRIRPIYMFFALFFWVQSLWIFGSVLFWRIPMAFHLYTGFFVFSVMLAGSIDWRSYAWSQRDRIAGILFAILCSASILWIGLLLKSTNNYPFLFARVAIVLIAGVAWLLKSPGILFMWMRWCLSWWRHAGAYSYGLYILQFPLLIVAYVVAETYLNSVLIGLFSVVPVVLFARYVELSFQPEAAKFLDFFLFSRLFDKRALE